LAAAVVTTVRPFFANPFGYVQQSCQWDESRTFGGRVQSSKGIPVNYNITSKINTSKIDYNG
jgi:hypothetical protein